MIRIALHFFFGILLIIATSCQKKPVDSATIPLYIGTYTTGNSEGIYMVKFNTDTGNFGQKTLVAVLKNPSYLTIHKDLSLLFVVSENDGRKAILHSYSINPATGLLTAIDSLQTGGHGACYVSSIGIDLVAVANYVSGDVTFVCFTPDGKFCREPQTFQHKGSGPNTQRQEAAHAHSALPDLNGNFIYAADLGIDKIMVYKNEDGLVSQVMQIPVAPGAGPRHIAFHPSEKVMAVLNELNHTIDVFSLDDKGIFSVLQHTVSILEDSLHMQNSSADIHFSADGEYLYASVRGVDKIEVLRVNQLDFYPRQVQSVDTGIHWPRNFALDPTGKFLLVANQKGNSVIVFARDKETGQLSQTGSALEVDSPACLKFE